ncbi:MAG: four helix bundle protein [Ignavibacteriaceae bacterium]|jgi:four helix bundle protein|nr:four helix bundle protein [Ignavibacteriaceae bacterium]
MEYPDFMNMSVWKKSIELLLKIYEITKNFPSDERFGLISDMRRAVNSISHNFAEGFGRYEPRDKTRFYKISRGSGYELMSQSFASFKLGFIPDKNILDEIILVTTEIVNELTALIISLEKKAGQADD